ncbi:hypothetical protein AWZ03_013140 [Drosophila navojoa]|uniref:SKP1 component POZ domain-containing protein n=1 Tax=Drosophila navojoa TaxID=7232 RepID=A0A484AVK6_DRONA|nr:hypothetical protein AWZ03_013140 [Drosophila navojoa]
MLALMTQSTMPRWLQCCNNAAGPGRSTPINIILQSCEEVEAAEEPAKPVGKRKSSRIPRMIRPLVRQTPAEGTAQQEAPAEVKPLRSSRLPVSSHRIAPWSNRPTPLAVDKAIELGARPTNVKGYSFSGFGTSKPDEHSAGVGVARGAGIMAAAGAAVVRSTRTSRCRMQLNYRDSLATPKAPSQAKLTGQLQLSQALRQRSYFQLCRPKCYTEPLLPPRRSLSPAVSPFVELPSGATLLCFECSDRKQVKVPSALINRFSPLLSERQQEPLFNYEEPIELSAVSARTLQRLILWMDHHAKDDIYALHKMQPIFSNSSSPHCTWDEDFLGSNLDEVLQLLLAANCLAVYPLVEHAMHYFIALIEQRNTDERNGSLSELQSELDELY